MHEISGFGWQAVVSDQGAELQSFRTKSGAELLWQGDAAWWSGRSPVLFPIVGRARDDRLTLGGVPVQMAQHGFARRQPFQLAAHGPDFTRHVLRDTPETLAIYPRAFELVLEHRLIPEGLQISAEVHNRGDQPMPFALGFHPAFAYPLPGAAQPHAVQLDNDAEPRRTPLEAGLLRRDTLPSPFRAGHLELTEGIFDHDALVFLAGAGQGLRYGPPDGPQIRFAFANLPFLALWSKPGAAFVCIEPWQGAAAFADAGPALEDRPGTRILGPGQAEHFAMRIEPEGF